MNDLHHRARDPLELWDAYEMSRLSDQPIPERVLDYFDRVAARLSVQEFFVSAATLGRKRMRGFHEEARRYGVRRIVDPGRAVLHALEMDRRGRGDVFRRSLQTRRTKRIANEVAWLVMNGTKPYLAIDEVHERRKISLVKVRRACTQHPTALADLRAQRDWLKAEGMWVEPPDKT